MNFDEAADTFHSIFGARARHAVETRLDACAEAWTTYEQGMDWDPNYLVSMGTLDMDTEEFAAVGEAAEALEGALASEAGAVEGSEAAVRARAFLAALDAYRALGWDAPDSEHEQLARSVSAALGVPFAGRHGGISSNNPC